MFDNICSLPIPTDIFTQAVHPTEPIFTLGLASGHVYSNRLPAVGKVEAEPVLDNSIGSRRSSANKSTRVKRNGFDKVDWIWETRRHKGSCRSLCYSADGRSLFSAGSDGLVKAADFETGRVQSKIAVPYEVETASVGTPTVVHTLSPQILLLGTEEAALHVYDLRKNNFSSYKPQQTYRPHDDYISSITPLPSTSSPSSSGTSTSTTTNSKQIITTGDTTLAITDIRKGVLQRSEDQEEALLCSAFINTSSSNSNSSKNSNGKVLVGGAGGVLTLWQPGFWQDQDERIVLDRSPGGGETIDVITRIPDAVGTLPGRKVAVGLGNGQIRFVRIGDNNNNNKAVGGGVRHDEAEGVVAIGFDVAGRMISSGGSVVKIWHEKVEGEEGDEKEEDEEEDEVNGDGDGVNGTTKRKAVDGDSGGSDDDNEEEEEEKEKPHKRRKRKRQNKAARRDPGPGIMAFKGL